MNVDLQITKANKIHDQNCASGFVLHSLLCSKDVQQQKKYFKNSTKGCVKGIENNCHLDKRHAAAQSWAKLQKPAKNQIKDS